VKTKLLALIAGMAIAVFTTNGNASGIVVPIQIPATGESVSAFPYTDLNYTNVNPADFALGLPGNPLGSIANSIISGTAPGFIPAPAGSQWIAPGADTGAGLPGIVLDFRVFFNVTTAGPTTISGDLAANGSVAVFLDGVGKYLGNQSLTVLNPFSFSANAVSGSNYLDFIFNGCLTYPACTGTFDPVVGLLVDPQYVPAPPGITLDNVLEADAIANGGVSPNGGTTPLPAALPLFATGLGALGLLGWRRKRKAAAIA
jgi:hypothetical protein